MYSHLQDRMEITIYRQVFVPVSNDNGEVFPSYPRTIELRPHQQIQFSAIFRMHSGYCNPSREGGKG